MDTKRVALLLRGKFFREGNQARNLNRTIENLRDTMIRPLQLQRCDSTRAVVYASHATELFEQRNALHGTYLVLVRVALFSLVQN